MISSKNSEQLQLLCCQMASQINYKKKIQHLFQLKEQISRYLWTSKRTFLLQWSLTGVSSWAKPCCHHSSLFNIIDRLKGLRLYAQGPRTVAFSNRDSKKTKKDQWPSAVAAIMEVRKLVGNDSPKSLLFLIVWDIWQKLWVACEG